jgi:ubiquitin C-terminal hydrolase
MLGDLFEAAAGSPSMETGKSGKTFTPASKQVKKRYLADDMDLPPIKREKGQFSGLVNQGGTCYLNALFQALYFCPEFRHLLLQIDLDEVTAYEKGTQKYNLIREFQAFFMRLKCLSFKNHVTSVGDFRLTIRNSQAALDGKVEMEQNNKILLKL